MFLGRSTVNPGGGGGFGMVSCRPGRELRSPQPNLALQLESASSFTHPLRPVKREVGSSHILEETACHVWSGIQVRKSIRPQKRQPDRANETPSRRWSRISVKQISAGSRPPTRAALSAIWPSAPNPSHSAEHWPHPLPSAKCEQSACSRNLTFW